MFMELEHLMMYQKGSTVPVIMWLNFNNAKIGIDTTLKCLQHMEDNEIATPRSSSQR